MDKKIQIFGKKFKRSDLWIYIIFIVVFSIYSFIERPFVKSMYLQGDIEDFEDNYFWKIWLLIVCSILIFGFIKIKKQKWLITTFLMNCILFFLFTYLFLNNLISTQALFLNQLKSFEKEKVVYRVFNYDKPISIVDVKNGDNSDFNINEEKFIEKIEKKRQMNHQKSLHKIKHGDTIHINFEKGLIGFKYLN